MPRFSIIIPVYNSEAYLHACLDSVCKLCRLLVMVQKSELNIKNYFLQNLSHGNIC